jgi:hypothetical protein
MVVDEHRLRTSFHTLRRVDESIKLVALIRIGVMP